MPTLNRLDEFRFTVDPKGETEVHQEIKKEEPKEPSTLRIGGKVVEITSKSGPEQHKAS